MVFQLRRFKRREREQKGSEKLRRLRLRELEEELETGFDFEEELHED